MTLPTGSKAPGVTLIELIIVMALLTTVAALTAPRLTAFLGGRSLQAECTRFIALTRHARSEAISQGVRTEVWLDVQEGAYGMRAVAAGEGEGEGGEETNAREYPLGRDFHFELDADTVQNDGTVTIAYRPDGTLDGDLLQRFWIMRGDGDGFQIALDESRAKYEIFGRDEETIYDTDAAR